MAETFPPSYDSNPEHIETANLDMDVPNLTPANDGFQKPGISEKEASSMVAEETMLTEPKHQDVNRLTTLWEDSWAPEIASCALAVLSLFAIVILLAMHEDAPLPRWPKLITINSLLAVFSTFFRMGLVLPLSEGISQIKWQLFGESRILADIDHLDAASRGPMGSLMLLMRGRGGFIPLVGAILTILTLVTDPFFQQLVHYNSCLQPKVNGIATIPRTNFYMDYGQQFAVSHAMAVAINTGAVIPARDASLYISAQCESRNCTFSSAEESASNVATYSSVGLCYTCADITNQIQNVTDRDTKAFVLPGNESLGESTLHINGSIKMSTTWFYGHDNLLGTVKSLQWDPEYGKETPPPAAFSCSLYPCVKTYSGKIIDGVLNESILHTDPIGINLVYSTSISIVGDAGFYRLARNQTLRNGTYSKCKKSASKLPDYYPVARENYEGVPSTITIDPNMVLDVSWYPPECVWSLGYASTAALQSYMWTLFQFQQLDVIRNSIILSSFYSDGLYNLTSVSNFWKATTDAMTAVMRTDGKDGVADYAYGTAMSSETCASVEWAWIALPTILVLGVFAFILAVIMKSPRRRVQPLWKSSALALVFTHLDVRQAHTAAQLPTKTELDRMAGETKVRFRNDNGRLQLL